ncbi:GNAT family N-acetyltransferase, partial [Lutispora sp.]|uniref:GNAT family N-acetyltransferase n=1 Tax=Lutispora sp. TaxID=2828727 RepID=UPI002B207893
AYQLNLIPQHKCKAFPTDYNKILRQFENMINHPNDELLISTDDLNISGVLALLVEPEDMYLEAIGGVFAKNNYEAVAKEFYTYLEDNYKGYRFDAPYPEENEQAIDFMKSIGAELLDFDYELRLSKNEYESMAEIDNIIMLNEKYYGSFVEIHNKFHPDAYWTGERLLKALDKFDIFIILEEEKVIGSIVTSKFSKEIYLMEVSEDKQNLGYGTALINKAIKHAFNNGADELMVMVEKNNLVAIHMYEKFGFKKTDTCLTYSKKLG